MGFTAMKTRMILVGGLSALVMGGTMVGCSATGGGGGVASASDRSAAVAARSAAAQADKATHALARQEPMVAVGFAEGAAGLAPRNAAYRMLLGQAYLQSGRFVSAKAAFGEALALSPQNGRAALNLALSTIATGDYPAARRVLDANSATIPVADRGLAMALAGDPAGAVAVLTQLARSPQSDAKARQNLALALALGGQWQGARVVAAADMSPADVDRRMQEWAAFAQPATASDQVAQLLGVHAVADQGQPIALALNGTVSVAQATPVEGPTSPVPATAVAAAPAGRIAFAAPHAVVQPLPAPLLRAEPGATKVALGAASVVPAAQGPFYVQLGAFGNASVARDAWGRANRRFVGFAGHVPSAMTIRARGAALYRLSVGGYARGEADAVCRRYRQAGGACFVRHGAGDQVAAWARQSVQLAAR